MDAVIGAMYAADPDSGKLKKTAEAFFAMGVVKEISSYFSKVVPQRPFGKVFSLAKQFFILNRALIKPAVLTNQVERIFSGLPFPENFSALKIPFCAVATNIGRDIEADFIISPDVSGFHWANFKRFAGCIKKGKIEAFLRIAELRRKIRRKKITALAKRFFR